MLRIDFSTTILALVALCSNASPASPCPKGCTCPSPGTLACSGHVNSSALPPGTQALLLLGHLPAPLVLEALRLRSLQALDVSHTGISILPPDAFSGCPALLSLNLSHNALRGVREHALHRLPSLRLLDLSHNRIRGSGLFDLLQRLSSLSTLNVSHNALRQLDGFRAGRANPPQPLPHLRHLDVSYNRIVEMSPVTLSAFPGLVTLRASHNRLEELSEELFQRSRELRFLDLAWNQLSRLPEGLFGGTTALEKLDLRANRLASIPSGLLGPLGRLAWLQLEYNPWECDCSLWGLRLWLEWLTFRGGEVDRLSCSAPRELRNRPLQQLSSDMFSWCQSSVRETHSNKSDGSQRLSESLLFEAEGRQDDQREGHPFMSSEHKPPPPSAEETVPSSAQRSPPPPSEEQHSPFSAKEPPPLFLPAQMPQSLSAKEPLALSVQELLPPAQRRAPAHLSAGGPMALAVEQPGTLSPRSVQRGINDACMFHHRVRARQPSVRYALTTVVVAGVVCGLLCVMMAAAAGYGCVYAAMAAHRAVESRRLGGDGGTEADGTIPLAATEGTADSSDGGDVGAAGGKEPLVSCPGNGAKLKPDSRV
ncbi:leucine-rich repeat and transmembrane domain-containing protein 1-like [Lethenteron reissneri]|uniref:leucine-rich repeat and transmembrane domain-containing protein 1-like n=1 Tax=Lethenteron reissneri TaxID=7753 RepID=UPI002AB670E3|nr:leucine-rich repeat and transmembrane domain-containing protein 1-like [Lethenteron reissneri]